AEVRYDVAPAVARLRGVHLRIVTAEDRRARTCGERSEVIRPQPEGCRAQRDPDRRRRVDGDCRDRQLGAVLADGSREAHHPASRDPVELGPGQLRLRSAHTPAQLVEEHGAARRGGQHLPNQTLAPRRSGPPVHHDRAILVLRWPGDPCHRSTGPGVPARYAPAATPSPFHSSNCFGSSTSFAKANRRSFSSTSKSAAAPAAAPFCSSPPNDRGTGSTSSTASNAVKNAGSRSTRAFASSSLAASSVRLRAAGAAWWIASIIAREPSGEPSAPVAARCALSHRIRSEPLRATRRLTMSRSRSTPTARARRSASS